MKGRNNIKRVLCLMLAIMLLTFSCVVREEETIEPPAIEEEDNKMEEIEDEKPPLVNIPVDIEDEDVPLESEPVLITGDNGWFWYAILIISLLRLIVLVPTLKKEKS